MAEKGRYLIIALAVILTAASLYRAFDTAARSWNVDFFGFWAVSTALCRGDVDIYSDQGQRRIALEFFGKAARPGVSGAQRQATGLAMRLYGGRIPSSSSPLLHALIRVGAGGDYERDRRVFLGFSLVCFALSIVILCRLLKYRGIAIMFILASLALFFAPLISDLRVGNINQIQLLLLALFISLYARSDSFLHIILAGSLLGLSLMLKPALYLIPPLLIIAIVFDRKYRELYPLLPGTAIGAAIAVLIGSAYFGGAGIWIRWIGTLPATLKSTFSFEYGNYSLSSLIFHFRDADISFAAVSALSLIFLAGLWTVRGGAAQDRDGGYYRPERVRRAFIIAGGGCVIMLLSSGFVWIHYYVLLIPAALFVLRPVSGGRGGGGRTAARLSSLAALALLFDFRLPNALIDCLRCVSAAMILFMALLYELRGIRTEGV